MGPLGPLWQSCTVSIRYVTVRSEPFRRVPFRSVSICTVSRLKRFVPFRGIRFCRVSFRSVSHFSVSFSFRILSAPFRIVPFRVYRFVSFPGRHVPCHTGGILRAVLGAHVSRVGILRAVFACLFGSPRPPEVGADILYAHDRHVPCHTGACRTRGVPCQVLAMPCRARCRAVPGPAPWQVPCHSCRARHRAMPSFCVPCHAEFVPCPMEPLRAMGAHGCVLRVGIFRPPWHAWGVRARCAGGSGTCAARASVPP